MGLDSKTTVILCLIAVSFTVGGGYLPALGEQMQAQASQQSATHTTGDTTAHPNSSADLTDSRARSLAAPSQPTVVTTNHSAPRTLDLSAGESATVTVGVTATQRLSDVRINTTDPLGLTVSSEPAVVDRLDTNESTGYRFTVTADQSVSRTLDVVVQATHDNRSVSQRISYPVDALANETDGTQSGAVQTDSFTAVGAPMRTESTNQTTLSGASSGITVSGQAAYTDPSGRLYGLSDVRVELYDVDGGQTQLARTTAAQDGEFTFRLDPENDADGDGTIQAAVVIYAENDAAYVSNGNSLYGFVAETGLLSAGDAVTLGADLDSDGSKELVATGNNAPFQAVDWAADAYEFGADSSLSTSQVPIQYPVGDWAYFTYRTDGRQLMQLPDRSYYPWTRNTIYHEYGHSVFFQLRDFALVESGSYSCHVYVSETDPGYALVEGFAEYYAAAVADDPNAVSWGTQTIERNRFYDTAYTGQCADGDASGEYDGLSVEGSAASIFWDITDGGSNDDDRLSHSFGTVAETLRSEPEDMTEFRNEWRGGDGDALDETYTNYGIDRLPPTITYTVDEAPYTDTEVQFSGSVDDERSVTTLEVSINGSPYRTVETDDGRWSVTRQLSDGTSTVSVRATDPGGFTRERTETVRVSSNSPSTSITEVRPSALESSDATVQVDFAYAARYPDSATVRVLRNGGTVATKSLSTLGGAAAGRDASTAIALPETASAGTYTVELVLTDDAGRTVTDQYTTTLRIESPPTITGDVTNETDVGLAGVTVQLYAVADTDFSDPLQTTQTNATGSYTLSTADGEVLQSGENYVVRVSVDGATTNRTLGPLQSGTNEGDLVVTTGGTIVLGDLSPATATVADGENFTVSTNATNTGETTRASAVVLRVNDTLVRNRTVTLGGGENRTITFEDVGTSALDAGEYTYAVSTGDSRKTGTLTIEPSTTGGSRIVGRYDTNDDGDIELRELAVAATDYSNGDLSLLDLADIAQAYSAGTTSP